MWAADYMMQWFNNWDRFSLHLFFVFRIIRKSMLSSCRRCVRSIYRWGTGRSEAEALESGSWWASEGLNTTGLRLTFSEGRRIAATRRKFLRNSIAWDHVTIVSVGFPACLCNSNIPASCRYRYFHPDIHLKAPCCEAAPQHPSKLEQKGRETFHEEHHWVIVAPAVPCCVRIIWRYLAVSWLQHSIGSCPFEHNITKYSL